MRTPVTEFDDIQGLLKSGYGPLTAATYLLLWVRDAKKARAWLKAFRPTTMAELGGRAPLERARHVAISAPGLLALGLAPATLEGFAPEFVSGMSADPARSRRLGDVGANAPSRWDWGRPGEEPHLVVLLFSKPGDMAAFKAETLSDAAAFQVTELSTAPLDGREPFGFVDGLSQPMVDWAAARKPGGMEDLDYGNLISAGEFVLGYPNEYGLVTRSPHEADLDLGRNGTYLVLRQLHQDVDGFWRFADANGGLPLAEAMVGRQRLALAPASGRSAG